MPKPFGTPVPKLFDKEKLIEPMPLSPETERALKELDDYITSCRAWAMRACCPCGQH